MTAYSQKCLNHAGFWLSPRYQTDGSISSDKSQENINYDFQEMICPEEMNEKQKQHIDKVLQLLENVDLVMSSKERFMNILK